MSVEKKSFSNSISVPCGTGETVEPFRKIRLYNTSYRIPVLTSEIWKWKWM